MTTADPEWSISGRTALVTGAGRNIGRAIVLALAAKGANVVVNVRRNKEEADAVCAEASALGVRALPVAADLASSAEIARMFAEVHEALGPVSVLVNNAAIRPHQAFLDITEEDWDLVLGVGLRAPFLASQAAARDMVALGGGRIINVSGRDGFIGRANRAHGVAAKAGIHGLTKALAVELGPMGITTNTVVPGVVETTRPAEWYPGHEYVERATRIPVRRVGRSSDIARACAFLATDPGYINGAALHVNGGESLI